MGSTSLSVALPAVRPRHLLNPSDVPWLQYRRDPIICCAASHTKRLHLPLLNNKGRRPLRTNCCSGTDATLSQRKRGSEAKAHYQFLRKIYIVLQHRFSLWDSFIWCHTVFSSPFNVINWIINGVDIYPQSFIYRSSTGPVKVDNRGSTVLSVYSWHVTNKYVQLSDTVSCKME